MEISVQPEWVRKLPLQQQSVLLLASRGPDGIDKYNPVKHVHRAYRACIFMAAKYGRMLEWGEKADSFMSLEIFADHAAWAQAVDDFLDNIDTLPYHYVTHLMHGAEILGYKHPDKKFRDQWRAFFLAVVDHMHLAAESEETMDQRLGDWQRKFW